MANANLAFQMFKKGVYIYIYIYCANTCNGGYSVIITWGNQHQPWGMWSLRGMANLPLYPINGADLAAEGTKATDKIYFIYNIYIYSYQGCPTGWGNQWFAMHFLEMEMDEKPLDILIVIIMIITCYLAFLFRDNISIKTKDFNFIGII